MFHIFFKKVINEEVWFQEWLDSASDNNHKTEQKYSKTNKSVAMESNLKQSENRGNLILKKESVWMIVYIIFPKGASQSVQYRLARTKAWIFNSKEGRRGCWITARIHANQIAIC